MANPYPVAIQDERGIVHVQGDANFTDPDNRPGGGSQPVVISDTEPAETFAGMLWIQTGVEPPKVQERTDADDGWNQVYPPVALDLEDVLTVGNNGGGVGASNFGSLSLGNHDFATGGGSIDTGGGNATVNRCRIDENIDHNGARIGFFGTAPAVRPSVAAIADPSTASAEDVANAVNALLEALHSVSGSGLIEMT